MEDSIPSHEIFVLYKSFFSTNDRIENTTRINFPIRLSHEHLGLILCVYFLVKRNYTQGWGTDGYIYPRVRPRCLSSRHEQIDCALARYRRLVRDGL